MYRLKFFYQLAALGVLCAASTVAAHAATIVFSTGFNNGATTAPTPAGSTVGSPETFSVTGGDVFYLGGVANDPANPCFQNGSSSATCLQLPTYQGITPQLTSAHLFGPGDYLVEIAMAGGGANAVVLAELGAPQMITVLAGSQFNTYQFTHTVPNGVHTPLTISANHEFLIDSIVVGTLTGESPVPEPATWSMLAAGLGLGWAGIYRRRRVGAVTSGRGNR